MSVRAVILVESGFQDEEFIYPYYRVKEARWEVEVATPDGKNRVGKFGVPARATTSIALLDPDDYEAVIVPGGFESPDRLRATEAPQFVAEMWRRSKLCAAICHGPWVLISAGVLRGHRATSYRSIRDDVVNAGATWVDEPVVRDSNLITAQHYAQNGDFMRAVVDYFR